MTLSGDRGKGGGREYGIHAGETKIPTTLTRPPGSVPLVPLAELRVIRDTATIRGHHPGHRNRWFTASLKYVNVYAWIPESKSTRNVFSYGTRRGQVKRRRESRVISGEIIGVLLLINVRKSAVVYGVTGFLRRFYGRPDPRGSCRFWPVVRRRLQ